MKRIIGLIYSIIPYIVVELLQFTLLAFLLYLKKFIPISEELLYLLSVSTTAVIGIIYFIWYRFEVSGEDKGSKQLSPVIKNSILLLCLGLGCQFFFSGVMTLIKPLFEETFSEYEDILKTLTSGNQLIVLLFMILIAPVTEELIFRGVILGRANKLFGSFYANILQAALFGLYHGNVIQGIYAFIIGLLLGRVYIKFKTLYASILLHVFINTSSLLMLLLPKNIIATIVILLIGGVLIVLSLKLLALFKPGSRQRIE